MISFRKTLQTKLSNLENNIKVINKKTHRAFFCCVFLKEFDILFINMNYQYKKTLFATLSLITILSYSYFAFAAAPLGGYNPGDTLNPDCAPGDVDCVVTLPSGGSVTADNGLTVTGSNVQLGGVLIQDTNIQTLGNDFTIINDLSAGLDATGVQVSEFAPGIFTAGFRGGSTTANSEVGIQTISYGTDAIARMFYSDKTTGNESNIAVLKNSVNIGFDDAVDNEKTFFSASDEGAYIAYQDLSWTPDQSNSFFVQKNGPEIRGSDPVNGINTYWSVYDPAVLGNVRVNATMYNNGDFELSNYLSSRDDSGVTMPLNFLYTDGSGRMQSSPLSALGGSGWSLTGNSGTTAGTNFIGTTDAQDFVIAANGNEMMRFLQDADLTSTNVLAVQLLGGTASGNVSFAWSQGNATGIRSSAWARATASGIDSTAWGTGALASGAHATAWGTSTEGSGDNSTAFGVTAIASGDMSTAFGRNVQARSFGEVSFGIFGSDYTPIDETAFSSFDRLFSIGNGDLGTHNAYTLWKDGSFTYNDDNFQNDTPGTEQNMFYFNYGNHDGLGAAQTKRAIRLGSATNDEWDINSANVGNRSLAFGFEGAIASGYSSIAIGTSAVSGEESTVAIGNNTVANGVQSFAFGFGAQATANNSLALGTSANAGGIGSVAIATGNGSASASGQDSVSIGGGSASGVQSFAINATASGYNAVAINNGGVASGDNSFAVNGSSAQGYNSVSFGQGNNAYSSSETVFGSYATNYSPIAVNSWDGADRLFVVGNGDDSIPDNSDALTILKNGQTGIAIDNFEANTNGNIFQVGDGATGIIGYVDNGTGNWVAVSDERKKDNITDLTYGLNELIQLRPTSFNYKRNNEHTIGFLAQQVLPIIPMNLKITDIGNMETPNTWRDSLIAWFGNTANGITDFFSKKPRSIIWICMGSKYRMD
jgi:hypothetical protein